MSLPPVRSLWLTEDIPSYQHELTPVDVVVVGGGIAGITTAYLLKNEGFSVALIEGRTLFNGTTGHTTAKVSTQHGRRYEYLVADSVDKAKSYASAQQDAFDWLSAEILYLDVDCDYKVKDSYIYASYPESRSDLMKQAVAQQKAGLISTYTDTVDLPFETAGAVKVPNQAQFHPVKWLKALVELIDNGSSYVTERTMATDVIEGDGYVTVETTAGDIRASHVVVATHVPFLDKGGFTSRMIPVAEMVVAGPVDNPASGMYISFDEPHSIRYAEHDGQPIAIVLGEYYHPGSAEDLLSRHERLAAWAQDNVGLRSIDYRWSASDYVTTDKMPFIGKYSNDSDRIWVATGFGQWGMTNGTLSGMMISDMISGRINPYEDLFDPSRVSLGLKALQDLLTNAWGVTKHRVTDPFKHHDVDGESLELGEAKIVSQGKQIVAASKDEDGNVTELSAKCRHLGCTVVFNNDERSWDCPCHGSRYDLKGNVIHGPANFPLKKLDE